MREKMMQDKQEVMSSFFQFDSTESNVVPMPSQEEVDASKAIDEGFNKEVFEYFEVVKKAS